MNLNYHQLQYHRGILCNHLLIPQHLSSCLELFHKLQHHPNHLENVNQEPKAGDDAATAHWYDLKEVWTTKEMAFDHKDIVKVML